MKELQDLSLRGKVFLTIRENILSGKYQEYEELHELTLAKELGVSRTPVREALHQLELEGLVTLVPNKGVHVIGITWKDVHDIYMIRSMLEGLCARWATENITEEQIDEMEETLQLAQFQLSKKGTGKTDHVSRLDDRFHQILYEASDSRMLEHLLSDFHKYVRMARKKSIGAKDRAEKSVEEHRELLEAIKNKDADLAEKLANRHILQVMDNLHLEE